MVGTLRFAHPTILRATRAPSRQTSSRGARLRASRRMNGNQRGLMVLPAMRSIVRRRRYAPPHHEDWRAHMSSFGQLTIQGMPNLSTHMPKPLEKKVLPNGIRTVPPSASALKRRSASAGSSIASATEKPCG
ncbi:hypothetical protein ACVWVY_002249 [Bradyrhizobium sp. URHC0002]